MRRGRAAALLVALGLLLALPAGPGAAIMVDPVTVEGTVTGPGDAPLEGARVEVVGMEEHNATTDAGGNYSFQVPFLQPGHTLRFTHPDHATREVTTGPLEPLGRVTVDVTMALKPSQATLHVRILPWDMPGSNYGLRQDVMTVVNATGTPGFEFTEKSAEERVVVPAPGTYLVTATRPGYYPLTVTVSAERGDSLTVDLDLTDRKRPTHGTVTGNVTFKGLPVGGASLVAAPADGSRTWEAVTDDQGRFSMQLPNGTYKLSVRAGGYSRLSEGVALEAGESVDVTFPLSVAQDTGDEGGSLLGWAVLVAALAVLSAVVVLAARNQRRAAREGAEERAREEELTCPECGAPAGTDAERCAECGAAFPWKSFRCPECGTVMELDARRCPECGNETFDLHGG